MQLKRLNKLNYDYLLNFKKNIWFDKNLNMRNVNYFDDETNSSFGKEFRAALFLAGSFFRTLS